MKQSRYSGFAVIVNSTNKKQYLAIGVEGTAAIFPQWKAAAEYRRELKAHGISVGKVVSVSIQITINGQGN